MPVYLPDHRLTNLAVVTVQGIPSSSPAITAAAALQQNGPVPNVQRIEAPMTVEGTILHFLLQQKAKQSPEQQADALTVLIDPSSAATKASISSAIAEMTREDA